MSAAGQLTLFGQAADDGRNSALFRRAADNELSCILARKALRRGYQDVLAGVCDKYLRKWSVRQQLHYEQGRLLAAELIAAFGAAPEFGDDHSVVLDAASAWRQAHPGQTIVPQAIR